MHACNKKCSVKNVITLNLFVVEYFCSAFQVLFMRRKQEVEIYNLLIKKLAQLKILDISGCTITDKGADLISATLIETVSLEEFDISYTNLNTPNCNKITAALRNISSLRCFKMNNNFVTEKAALSITAAVSSNCLIEELDFSENELSSIALVQIINVLSKRNAIRILDVSKNCVSINSIESLSTTLANCHTLEKLNLSKNSLLFTGVLQIAQALRCHPSLTYLNFEKNIVSCFAECEFLVDVILSANKPLLYLNVCGRNIRPRFGMDHITPPCSHEKGNNFLIQSLFLPDLLLSGGNASSSIRNPTDISQIDTIIEVIEECPLASDNISTYYVDNNGGTFYNKAHNFTIVIPPGAVLQGDCVQIQATASRFGPYQLQDGYYPISSFFWVSAHYTFKIPVYLVLSHHASPRNMDELNKLHAMEACAQNLCTTSDGKLLMKTLFQGVNFDSRIGYCVLVMNHFCSHCLAKKDVGVPDKFHALYYTYNFEGFFKAEVCMCHVNKECIEVCTATCMYDVGVLKLFTGG